MRVRRKYLRAVAERLLVSHAVTAAPVPVEQIACALGIDVRATRPDDISLSGFLVRDDGTGKAIMGVNQEHHSHRKRFTIAHEIGHFLLHTGQEIYVDESSKSGLRISLRNENSGEGKDVSEIEANEFAAELLMPIKLLQHDIALYNMIDEDDLEKSIDKIARKYDVSRQALTYRLVNLGYIHL